MSALGILQKQIISIRFSGLRGARTAPTRRQLDTGLAGADPLTLLTRLLHSDTRETIRIRRRYL